MAMTLRNRSAPALRWWVQRNPAYVLSAACIACGAQMLLVPAEKPPAGDLAVILLTLGVLQAYEAGVTTIMLVLHRRQRSPEDQPSLFIVEAIFWTGPLIATMEMTALDRSLGLSLALGAALIAIGELQALARYFHWRLAWSTHAVAAACLLLVAIAQPLLKVDDATQGTNEMLLYALWWVVAGLLLMAVPGLRRAQTPRVDTGVIVAAAGAAVLHLIAMNHAFFGHGHMFYAAAPLAAGAAAGMLALRRGHDGLTQSLIALFFWMPVLGIILSFNRFDPAFPLVALPLLLRDPLSVGLALAAAAWGCGFIRHRSRFLLHAAALTAMYALERFYYSGVLTNELALLRPSLETLQPEQRGVMLLTAAWYLGAVALWRRSREGVAWAVILHQLGVASLMPEHWRPADFTLYLTWGWTALLVIHLAFERPSLILRLMPIALLLVVSGAYANHWTLGDYAKAHAALLIVALATAGWLMPWTRYRSVATVIGVLAAAPYIVRWMTHTRHGPALAVTCLGFLLLASGTAISWWKQALLARLVGDDVVPDGSDQPAGDAGSG